MNPWNANRIDLSTIGANQRVRPSITAYPERINRSAYPQWVRAIQESGTAQRIAKSTTNPEAWLIAIRRFQFECERANIAPFISVAGQTNNSQLDTHLRRERLELVKFFTQSNLFVKFAKPVSHTIRYDFTSNGFTIHRSCRTRAGSDPTLRNWLTKIPYPKFARDTDKPDLFSKRLTDFTYLQIDYINSLRVDIAYSVRAPTLPVIDGRQRLPDKSTLANYIESNIWMPLVLAHRIPGLSLRQY